VAKYSLQRGDLVVLGDDGSSLWRGRPMNQAVARIETVPASEDAIALLKRPSTPGDFSNIVRIGPDGAIRWIAELPNYPGKGTSASTQDSYVALDTVTKTAIQANSWSGMQVWLDTSTGKIANAMFVK
jgi:hypothetical protein